MPTETFRNFFAGYYSNRNPLSQPEGVGIDSVIDGVNALHTERGTWMRKPGMTKWSNQSIGAADSPMGFYDYFDSGTKRVVVDGHTTIKEFTPTTSSTILAKGGSGNQASFADVRGTLYMSTNTVGGILHKRIGSSAAKAWGITGPAAAPAIAIAGGSNRIRIGWKYVYVYKDSTDSHRSSASPTSVSTGAVAAGTINITVLASIEPRVDKIEIYRTKDGGNYYYLLTELSNTNQVYNDASNDSQLNTLVLAPSVFSNDPPPPGLKAITYHVQRIWGIVGDDVRYSSHRIDGLITGIAEECFPDDQIFRFNAPIALSSISAGLVVFTRNGDVHLIRGKSFFDFDPDRVYTNFPVSSRNCVANDGDLMAVFTTGKEMYLITDTPIKISLPLNEADLADFDPANCYVTVHREGTKAAVFLSNGDSKIFRYGLDTGTWSTVWEVDGATVTTAAIRASQTAIGELNVLIGPKLGFSGYVWKLDNGTHMDDTISYPCQIRFGSFNVADPNEASHIPFVSSEATVAPTAKILLNEISGTAITVPLSVQDHPLLPTTTTISSKIHYPQQIDASLLPSGLWCKNFQVEFVWDTVDDAAELYGFGYSYVPRESTQTG